MEVVLIRLVRVHSFVWRLSHTSTLFLTLQPARPTGKAWLLFCFKSYSRGRRLFHGNSCISEVISRIVTRDIETWVCPLLTVEQVLFSSHLLCGFFYQGTFPNHSREVITGMCPNILTRSCPYRCRQTVVRTNEKERDSCPLPICSVVLVFHAPAVLRNRIRQAFGLDLGVQTLTFPILLSITQFGRWLSW